MRSRLTTFCAVVVTAAVLLLALAACGDRDPEADTADAPPGAIPAETVHPEPEPESQAEDEPEPTADDDVEEDGDDGHEVVTGEFTAQFLWTDEHDTFVIRWTVERDDIYHVRTSYVAEDGGLHRMNAPPSIGEIGLAPDHFVDGTTYEFTVTQRDADGEQIGDAIVIEAQAG